MKTNMFPSHSRIEMALYAVAIAMLLGFAGCEKQGPLERAGEEVDEAANTLKNGRESTANKVDDAVDDVRRGAEKAADELKGK